MQYRTNTDQRLLSVQRTARERPGRGSSMKPRRRRHPASAARRRNPRAAAAAFAAAALVATGLVAAPAGAAPAPSTTEAATTADGPTPITPKPVTPELPVAANGTPNGATTAVEQDGNRVPPRPRNGARPGTVP